MISWWKEDKLRNEAPFQLGGVRDPSGRPKPPSLFSMRAKRVDSICFGVGGGERCRFSEAAIFLIVKKVWGSGKSGEEREHKGKAKSVRSGGLCFGNYFYLTLGLWKQSHPHSHLLATNGLPVDNPSNPPTYF